MKVIKSDKIVKVSDCVKAFDSYNKSKSKTFKYKMIRNESDVDDNKILNLLKKGSTPMNRKLDIACRSFSGDWFYDGKDIDLTVKKVTNDQYNINMKVSLKNDKGESKDVNLTRKMKIVRDEKTSNTVKKSQTVSTKKTSTTTPKKPEKPKNKRPPKVTFKSSFDYIAATGFINKTNFNEDQLIEFLKKKSHLIKDEIISYAHAWEYRIVLYDSKLMTNGIFLKKAEIKNGYLVITIRICVLVNSWYDESCYLDLKNPISSRDNWSDWKTDRIEDKIEIFVGDKYNK